MKIAQVIDMPVNQIVTRADHSPEALAGLGQVSGGLTRDQIKQAQEALLKLGYPLQGGADGAPGRTTKKAVELVEPKVNAARKAAAVAAGRSWQKLETGGSVNAALLAALFEYPDQNKSQNVPNPAYAATDAEKKAVKDLWASSGTGGGAGAGGGQQQTPPPPEYGFMQPYADWLKTQTYLPEFLQNPYVASGAVVVVGGLLIFGITRAMRSSPAAAPAVAGYDDLGAMRSGYEPPKRRKKRKIKAKSKK